MSKEILNFKKHKKLHLINIAEFFAHLAGGMMTPVYYLFTERIGGDAFDSGNTYGLYLMIHAIAIGIFSRNNYILKNRKKIIFISYFLQLSSSILYLFVSNILMLGYLQIFLAIQSSLYATVFHSYYGNIATNSEIEDSKVWSLWNISTYLGVGLASILGGYVATYYTFDYIFYLMMVFSTISTLISIKFEDAINL